MTTQLLTRNIDTQTRDEAASVTEKVRDRHICGVQLRLDDESIIELPKHLASVVEFLLHGVTQGDLRIESIPDELTTRTAADMLGISRPTLMKMVQEGTVPSHRVGSHHRFRFSDIAELRAKRKVERSKAFESLHEFDFENGILD